MPMLPDPLHPLIVHFPIVLVVLLPGIALAALWLIRRGSEPRRAWALPLVTATALSLSAWVAVMTGEQEEDRVEEIVGDAPLESHEESAEVFLMLSGAMVLLAAGGMAPGSAGRMARVAATVGAVALVGAGVQVGRSGGELVYRHGAASAYASPGADGVRDVAERSPVRQGGRRAAPDDRARDDH
jgi:uncharacterized membrane protein